MTLNKHLFTSAKEDWETPQVLFDKLHAEFHFTLDVCATKANAKCKRFYTLRDDGLKQTWRGRVWMNPPYGRGIDLWVQKAFESQTLCVCLLPVRSDTKWWHRYVMKAGELRLLTRRLSFGNSTNKAPFPAAIVVFPGRNTIPNLTSFVI